MTPHCTPPAPPLSRRAALARLLVLAGGGLAAMSARPSAAWAALPPRARSAPEGDPVAHPEPRAGVTAANVLPESDVSGKARDAYAAAREFPQVLDGLYCHCGCGKRDNLRSLLACFETRMPMSCGVCLGEARLAGRLAREGRTLADIREAVDAEYGD